MTVQFRGSLEAPVSNYQYQSANYNTNAQNPIAGNTGNALASAPCLGSQGGESSSSGSQAGGSLNVMA